MTDETPPRPRPRRHKQPEVPAPVPSGGQAFQLLSFPKPEAIVKPQPQIVGFLEEWLGLARQGRLVALGLIAVTDNGGGVQRVVHSMSTIAGLMAANRLQDEMLVTALKTVYCAPPGTIISAVKPENEVPDE